MNNFPSCFRRGPVLHGEAGRKKRCSARLAVQSVSRRTALPPRAHQSERIRESFQVGRFEAQAGKRSADPAGRRGRHLCGIIWCGLKVSATAARQVPAPLEKPAGRKAGPALPRLSL
jgi:hypothetical protein